MLIPLEWPWSMTTTGPFWFLKSQICSSFFFSSSRVTAIWVEMFLLQQITTFRPEVLAELGLSLNWKMELLLLMSQRAINPFELADAKICGTYLFHLTEVI